MNFLQFSRSLSCSFFKFHFFALAAIILAFFPGSLTGQDFDTSRFWKAAEEGDPIAQFYIGDAYFHGLNGFEKDLDQARYWLTKAADQGDADAQYSVGTILFKLTSSMIDQNKLKGSRDLYLALDEFSAFFEKSYKQGHPMAFCQMSMIEQINQKPIEQMTHFRVMIERLKPYDEEISQSMIKSIENDLPQLSDSEVKTAALAANKLNKELPLQVCKILTPKVVLDLPALNQKEAEDFLDEAYVYYQKKFPDFKTAKPSIKCIDRDRLANEYRKQTGFDFGVTKLDSVDSISVLRAMTSFGAYSSDEKTIFIVPRSVGSVLRFFGLETTNAKDYVKLFLVEKLAYKWACENFAASRLKFRPGYVGTFLSAFQIFVTNLAVKDFKVNHNIVKKGLFYALPEFGSGLETDRETYLDQIKTGQNFFEYLHFTYGFQASFKSIQEAPESLEALKAPEKHVVFKVSNTTSADDYFKAAVTNFKEKKLEEAKKQIYQLFSLQHNHAQGRFLYAVIAAKEGDFYVAWKNVEMCRKDMAKSNKFQSFISNLNKTAPKIEYLD